MRINTHSYVKVRHGLWHFESVTVFVATKFVEVANWYLRRSFTMIIWQGMLQDTKLHEG